MEAVGKYDAFFSGSTVQGSARVATLSQIKESFRNYTELGRTGELIMAERQGDFIVYLLPSRKLDYRMPIPVAFDSSLAGPMKLALGGDAGVTEALDHSGDKVVAAYEYLPFLELGLVAKIDKSEIIRPFINAAFISGAMAIVVILFGSILVSKIVGPLLSKVYEASDQIRKREEALRASEQRFRGYFELGQVGMAVTHPDKGWLEVNPRLQEMLGYELADLRKTNWVELTHADDLEKDLAQFNRLLHGQIDHYCLDKRFIRKDDSIL